MSFADEFRDNFLAEAVREVAQANNPKLWADVTLAKLLTDTLAKFGYEVVRNVNTP